MSTQTLFQTLKLPSGTWMIETVVIGAPISTPAPAMKEDAVRSSVPADPWWEAANTQIMKGVNCGA